MMYWSERGQGAFCNSRRLRVSGCQTLEDALISWGKGVESYERVVDKVLSLRRFGAATLELAYVASGHFDALWQTNLHPWDTAVGELLVREAGGFIHDQKPIFLASNPILIEELKSLIPTAVESL